jgi:hypothetical protein
MLALNTLNNIAWFKLIAFMPSTKTDKSFYEFLFYKKSQETSNIHFFGQTFLWSERKTRISKSSLTQVFFSVFHEARQYRISPVSSIPLPIYLYSISTVCIIYELGIKCHCKISMMEQNSNHYSISSLQGCLYIHVVL